jgi:tetratricopeptide (TPR) repeat protein
LLLYYADKGDMASATRYAEPCLREMEESQDLELLAPLAADLCPFLYREGDSWRLIQMAAPVIRRLEEAHRERDFFGGRFNAYSGLCAWCASTCGWLGDFAQGRELFEKGLRFAREVNHPYSLAFIKLCGGAMLAAKGDGKEAVEHLEHAMGHLEEVQANVLWALYQVGWATLMVAQGRSRAHGTI